MRLTIFPISVLVFLGLAAARPVRAMEGILQMQELLEERIKPVVLELDPKALVFVNLKPKRMEVELPTTPFLYKENVIDQGRGELAIEKADILILTTLKEIPAASKKLIRDLTGSLAGVTTIRTKQMPAGISRAPVAPAPAAPAVEESKASFFTSPSRGIMFGALLMLGAFLGAVILLAASNVRQGTEDLQKTLATGIEKLNVTIGAVKPAETIAAPEPDALTEPSSERLGGWDSVTDDTFAALLSDCYWGEFDSYAAFLWRRIPMARRHSVLAKRDHFPEYAAHVMWLKEDDFGNDQEPYYLNPLPIPHIDNTALTSLVKECPALLFRLPSLRLAGLKLPAKERIELTRKALATPAAAVPDFFKLKPSPRRKLPAPAVVRLGNEQEERDVLQLRDLPPELMESIPSLGWLDRLSDGDVTSILARFPAKDLGSAWVGPDATLVRLKKLLPAQKYRLAMACRERFGASRQSPAFMRLHAAAMERVKASAPQAPAQPLAA